MDKEILKAEIASMMARVYLRGLTTSLGGNISLRCGPVMLITPSALDKATLRKEDIAEVDLESGENLTPRLKLSIESTMHRSIYLKRKSANAVIHSHAPFATLFSSSGDEILTDLIAESYFQAADLAKAEYALMGTEALARIVSDAAVNHSVILMEKHGVVALSDKSLLECLEKLECLENAAKMSLFGKMLALNRLTEKEKEEIDRMKK